MIPRPCGLADLPRLTQAATTVFRGPTGGDLARAYPLLLGAENVGRLWVVEEDGEIAAHAGYYLAEAVVYDRRLRAALFGAVFTVPAHRGRSLATAVMEAALAAARAEGAEHGLISGKRALYQRLGFMPLPPTSFVVARPEPAPGWRVERARIDDAPVLADLHHREPVRFARSPARWRQLLEAETVFYGPGTAVLVRRGRRPVAYAAFEGRPTALASGGSLWRAVELAGDRQALLEASGEVAAFLGSDVPLGLVALPHNRALAEAAASRGWPTAALSLPFSAGCWTPAPRTAPQVAAPLLPFYGLNYV